MPGLETLTSESQMRQQSLEAHMTRLRDSKQQYLDKKLALEKELAFVIKELEHITQQTVQATTPPGG